MGIGRSGAEAQLLLLSPRDPAKSRDLNTLVSGWLPQQSWVRTRVSLLVG